MAIVININIGQTHTLEVAALIFTLVDVLGVLILLLPKRPNRLLFFLTLFDNGNKLLIVWGVF
jgi:hypothetical protein